MVLCSRRPVVSSWRSLLLGTRAPSLPLVTRSLWTVVPASRARVLYSSLAVPPAGMATSSGSFLTGLPGFIVNAKLGVKGLGISMLASWSDRQCELLACHSSSGIFSWYTHEGCSGPPFKMDEAEVEGMSVK